jgi:cell wall-associated NlpC family hydrolase
MGKHGRCAAGGKHDRSLLPSLRGPAKLPAMTKAAHYPGKPAPMPVRTPTRATALLALTAMLAGCGGADRVRPTPVAQRDWPTVEPADPARANAVLIRAISLVGTPYRYGGSRPEDGFDCSGLVNYVYRDMLDLKLPRSSRELAAWSGPRLPTDRLTTADLVFFASGDAVDHVGIYVGDGRFVHAPSSGGTVRLDRLDGPYWRERYAGSRRVLR